MESSTRIQLRAREAQPVARVHVDDDSVEIFLRRTEGRRVVIATLDDQGRPTRVAEWDRASVRQSPPKSRAMTIALAIHAAVGWSYHKPQPGRR